MTAANPWGKIALGVRVWRHPEGAFFQSWTALLTDGLRPGDTVLRPVVGLRGHQAADALALQFLRSDCDSLLLASLLALLALLLGQHAAG